MTNMNLMGMGALATTGVALLVVIISMATDYWAENLVNYFYFQIIIL